MRVLVFTLLYFKAQNSFLFSSKFYIYFLKSAHLNTKLIFNNKLFLPLSVIYNTHPTNLDH